jgi:Uma2 family endonuclease
VAGESLRFDRRTKAALYARNAIPEYWIVNLADGVIEVHRDPDPASGAYRQIRAHRRGDTLFAPFGEGIPVGVADLIP